MFKAFLIACVVVALECLAWNLFQWGLSTLADSDPVHWIGCAIVAGIVAVCY